MTILGCSEEDFILLMNAVKTLDKAIVFNNNNNMNNNNNSTTATTTTKTGTTPTTAVDKWLESIQLQEYFDVFK